MTAGATCSFARIEVSTFSSMQSSEFKAHENSSAHQGALRNLLSKLQPQTAESEICVLGSVSGRCDDVPRLDRFVLSLNTVACFKCCISFSLPRFGESFLGKDLFENLKQDFRDQWPYKPDKVLQGLTRPYKAFS